MTQRKIFWFWLPLAASWALMILQGPVVHAAIARLPDPETNLAAAGIVISLAVTIESPVIMVLATTTALATSGQAYRVLQRFVRHLTIILTIIAATIAFADPVYNWLTLELLGLPVHIAEAAQPGLKIMTLWSAVIGWRRFFQGILIRFGRTRRVGYGTGIRLAAVTITAILLVNYSQFSGVVVAACSWMAGVTADLIYAYFASRSVIKQHLAGPPAPELPDLTYREVAKYHAPLAATSLLTLLAQPMIGAGLARMAAPVENLAAWPVIFSTWLLFRSGAMALPEVVVALLKGPDTYVQLRRFSRHVAIGSSLVLALMIFSPLMNFYLLDLTGVTAELAHFIIPGVAAGLALPALHAIQSWQRGLLMVARTTADIYWGMGVNLAATAVGLVLGVMLQVPGAPAAAVALSLGMVAEIIFLRWRIRPLEARSGLAPFSQLVQDGSADGDARSFRPQDTRT